MLLLTINNSASVDERNISTSPPLRPLTSRLPCALCVSVRGVSSLTRTARCGALSSRSSAPSASRCGTPTTTASSSRLEMDGTPSSWRRSGPCETTPSPLRKGCLTWRYGGGNGGKVAHCRALASILDLLR